MDGTRAVLPRRDLFPTVAGDRNQKARRPHVGAFLGFSAPHKESHGFLLPRADQSPNLVRAASSSPIWGRKHFFRHRLFKSTCVCMFWTVFCSAASIRRVGGSTPPSSGASAVSLLRRVRDVARTLPPRPARPRRCLGLTCRNERVGFSAKAWLFGSRHPCQRE